jgi:hypothetical protein
MSTETKAERMALSLRLKAVLESSTVECAAERGELSKAGIEDYDALKRLRAAMQAALDAEEPEVGCAACEEAHHLDSLPYDTRVSWALDAARISGIDSERRRIVKVLEEETGWRIADGGQCADIRSSLRAWWSGAHEHSLKRERLLQDLAAYLDVCMPRGKRQSAVYHELRARLREVLNG